jgi:phosphoglycolate phosphatase-like HAD superfamily hydrolase
LDAVQKQLGYEGLKGSFDIIRRYEAEAVSQAYAHPVSIQAAGACAERGQHLAVFCSNMTETIKESLVLLDLHDVFCQIVGEDLVRNRKPNPEGLRAILSKWRLAPSEVAYVTSSHADMAMARDLGVHMFPAA